MRGSGLHRAPGTGHSSSQRTNGGLALAPIRQTHHEIKETPHPEGPRYLPRSLAGPCPGPSLRPRLGVCLYICICLLLSLGGCSSDPSKPGAADDAAESVRTDAANARSTLEMPEGWAEQHPVVSPNAQLELHWAELAERKRPRDPADGAGRVWVERVRPAAGARAATAPTADPGHHAQIEAGSRQRIELVFEVAESGIAEGGLLFVQSDPFWSWSEAQTLDPNAAGYTTARAREPGVELVPSDLAGAFRVQGRALRGGEEIDLVYGAGPLGARVDAYAERGAPLLIGVDATGDGTRAWLPTPALIDISARAPEFLVAFAPADIAPGAVFEISLALLDGKGNRAAWPGPPEAQPPESHVTGDASPCRDFAFAVTLIHGSLPIEAPEQIRLRDTCLPHMRHTLRMVAPPQKGTLRLRIQGLGALASFSAEVNPIVVRESDRRLVWGDLHGHSQLSDGTGTPEDYFLYARDVARLDAVALTDHDHWGIRPLDENPELVEGIRETTNAFHAPGRFITLPGYEWTNWVHGHRHVLSFDDALPFYSALDPDTDRPDELWDALRGQPVLTFAHHSAGEPVATNWFYRPDPVLEPVTEIVSVHGMSEAADAPVPVRGGEPGYFVRDTLLRGDRLGFIGSGDSHDGHPGLAQIAGGQGGLAGLMTTELSRPALLESLRRRHTIATNGIRPFLEVHIDETPMGGRLRAPLRDDASEERGERTELHLRIRYEATSPVERIDLIRSGRVAQVAGEAAMSIDLVRTIPGLAPGEFHYVRILQEDGGTAWSSPIFVDALPTAMPGPVAVPEP